MAAVCPKMWITCHRILSYLLAQLNILPKALLGLNIILRKISWSMLPFFLWEIWKNVKRFVINKHSFTFNLHRPTYILKICCLLNAGNFLCYCRHSRSNYTYKPRLIFLACKDCNCKTEGSEPPYKCKQVDVIETIDEEVATLDDSPQIQVS
jgi:hypothetical protein